MAILAGLALEVLYLFAIDTMKNASNSLWECKFKLHLDPCKTAMSIKALYTINSTELDW